MATSSIEEACEETREWPPAASKSLQRVGSGGSEVIDPEGCVEAESRKLPSSKYKGVVSQPNGRWGAQIYEKHQRIWLGTFNEEAEAARAYDVAVQRFRGRDAITNFKPLNDADDEDAEELFFLDSHAKHEIIEMLRKRTYHNELQQTKRSMGEDNKKGIAARSNAARQHLFDKAVTPSDVGKLNRLVIPKQHAEKYFPLQKTGGGASKVVLLRFEDGCGKEWRFRYSYWNSSHSYVLTRGWSRFVKEKRLEAGDVVTFQRSAGTDKQLFIDAKARSRVQVLRLFGVNIVRGPAAAIGEGGVDDNSVFCATGKKNRDHITELGMFKKQRTEAL
ncbi:hypothetical protein B296_00053055 [Ensete ventricosum]|uniref:Uncharacterized protein n=1 Tax=Ensete ventricosum TaxID=4639 RepID=A0A426WZ38_ENSVE|nr:hypothetical protein B296_00053055 [Ensete ventricosum]